MLHVTAEDLAALFAEAAEKGTPVRWRLKREYGEAVHGTTPRALRTLDEQRHHRLYNKALRQKETALLRVLRGPMPTQGLCARCARSVPFGPREKGRGGRQALAPHVRADGRPCERVRSVSRYRAPVDVTPCEVRAETCPYCGGVREWREGNPGPIHIGRCVRRLSEAAG